jgi:hypothetical protein
MHFKLPDMTGGQPSVNLLLHLLKVCNRNNFKLDFVHISIKASKEFKEPKQKNNPSLLREELMG